MLFGNHNHRNLSSKTRSSGDTSPSGGPGYRRYPGEKNWGWD